MRTPNIHDGDLRYLRTWVERYRKTQPASVLRGFSSILAARNAAKASPVFASVLGNLEFKMVGPSVSTLARINGLSRDTISNLIHTGVLRDALTGHARWGVRPTGAGAIEGYAITGAVTLLWTDADWSWLTASNGIINAYSLSPEEVANAIADYVEKRDGARPTIPPPNLDEGGGDRPDGRLGEESES